ncbi:hypothetical protein [Thiocapsa sp.]|uniref:hypothetical protein n=1 Tax=Thiocapsa sp. TaxID=2024551 RepID=UPI0025EFC437|nr:hypothetical protein [Thiocapsa sp.]
MRPSDDRSGRLPGAIRIADLEPISDATAATVTESLLPGTCDHLIHFGGGHLHGSLGSGLFGEGNDGTESEHGGDCEDGFHLKLQ